MRNDLIKFQKYIKNAVKQELSEQLVPRTNKKQQMLEMAYNRIKPMVVEQVRRMKMLKEGKDYAKLQQVVWCDSYMCSNEDGTMDELNQMYDDGNYQGMIDYLAQWDFGNENGGEIYDGIQQYDDVLDETDRYILVTVDPRHYGGERAYGLYVKLSPEEYEG